MGEWEKQDKEIPEQTQQVALGVPPSPYPLQTFMAAAVVSPLAGMQYPVTVTFFWRGGALPDAPFLQGQRLDVGGGAHQVDGRLPPPAVPHADKVPLAHQVARTGSGDFVRHQRVRPDALQDLPEQGGSRGLSPLWGHPCHPLTPAPGDVKAP